MTNHEFRERAIDDSGTVLWEEPYGFRRISAIGDIIVRDHIEYEVVACGLTGARGQVETVLRKTGKIYA